MFVSCFFANDRFLMSFVLRVNLMSSSLIELFILNSEELSPELLIFFDEILLFFGMLVYLLTLFMDDGRHFFNLFLEFSILAVDSNYNFFVG